MKYKPVANSGFVEFKKVFEKLKLKPIIGSAIKENAGSIKVLEKTVLNTKKML